MIHYLIVIIGSYIGFRTLGFDLDSVLVVLGALGIGIGFGLQSIVNNFVSGLDTARGTSYKGWDWRRHRSERATGHR